MLRYLSVVVLGFAGLGAVNPRLSWLYVATAAVFELWLLARIRAEGSGPPAVGEPPYHFTGDEAQFIGRFRFYFAYPALARDAASVLAALGLSSLLLAPAQGERIVAEGFVVKSGRTLTITRGEVHAARGGERKLVAIMQQTLMAMHGKADSAAPASSSDAKASRPEVFR